MIDRPLVKRKVIYISFCMYFKIFFFFSIAKDYPNFAITLKQLITSSSINASTRVPIFQNNDEDGEYDGIDPAVRIII